MTMPSTAPAARIKPSRAFADAAADDDEDAFSRLASRPKPASKLPPVEPKSLARPPTVVPRTTVPVPLPAPATQDKQDEEEDDYMSMTVADPTANETSLQRLKRRKLEASVRGQPMSKAELAEQERYKRDIGLATSILTNTNSKGLKMMKAMGFTTGSSLGKAAPTPTATTAGETSSSSTTTQKDTKPTEPIRPVIRESRMGIGHESDLKRKFSEFNTEEVASAAAKRQDVSPESYRNRLTLEAQQRRHEAQLFAAQSICEKLVTEDPPAGYDGKRRKKDGNGDAEQDGDGKTSSEQHDDHHHHHHSSAKEDFFTGNPTFTQIKQINLIYRGLLYRRALSDLTKKLRKRETENLASSKYAGVGSLPAYNSAGEFSVDDRIALGKDTEEEDVPDEEWEDEELEQFEKREVKDRLDEIVRYLRSQWRYCFWCKFRYATDEEMERDCPGLKEEDHD